jgi:hypothetical protein
MTKKWLDLESPKSLQNRLIEKVVGQNGQICKNEKSAPKNISA